MKTKDMKDTQLKEYFEEHVRYEIQMLLNATAAILHKLPIPNGLQYMPVESYGIHLRNMINFFYPSKILDSDVSAENFFNNSNQWVKVRPALSSILESAKKRADKEIGHLTTARIVGTPSNKVWNVKILTDEIMSVFQVFCKLSDKVKTDSLVVDLLKHYSQI